MTNVGLFQLGADSLLFLHEELAKAGPILSTFKPEWGHIWAYLPPSAAERCTLFDLQHGNAFTAEQAYEIQEHIDHFIAAFLEEAPGHILLAEDRFFTMNDPPNAQDQRIFQYENVTYHYLSNHADQEALKDTVGSASNYPLFLILTVVSSLDKLPARGHIQKDLAEELISNVAHVIVGAFDDEGYIVWSRQQTSALRN
jgi:hypothetical protein